MPIRRLDAHCDEVWQAGATLPREYEGCNDVAVTSLLDAYDCWDGSTLVVDADRFFAASGGEITEAPGAGYRTAYDECVGNVDE